MKFELVPFTELLSKIVDNRGKTCPTAETGIPLIATNCIRNTSLYPSYENVRYVSQETYDTWFRGHPEPGDFLFVTKGSPGRVCVVPDPIDFCIAQDMVAIRADQSKVYPHYLFAVLRSEYTQRAIENMHVGTLIPHFKKGDFNKLRLPLPNRETQVVIGDTYFALSAKIELNRQLNATLEQLARTLFQSWFVDFDPVRAKVSGELEESICRRLGLTPELLALFPAALEDSAMGEIPEGWRLGGLGEVIAIFDSKRVPLSSRERAVRKGIYPYYGAAAVMDYVDDFLFDGVHILTGEDGSVLNPDGTPIIQYVWGKFWANNHAHVLKGANGLSDEHLFIALKNTNISAFVNGAVQAKLNQANMKRIPLILADEILLEAFGKILKPLFTSIRNYTEESRTLATLRDELLPKLLAGDLRLN